LCFAQRLTVVLVFAPLIFDTASLAAFWVSVLRAICAVSVSSTLLPGESIAASFVPGRPRPVVRGLIACDAILAEFALKRIFAYTSRSRLAVVGVALCALASIFTGTIVSAAVSAAEVLFAIAFEKRCSFDD